MERRTFLKTVGGIATTTAVGAAGVSLFSSRGAALDVSISSNPVTVENDTGEVTEVAINPQFRVEWTGFDEPVGKVFVLIEAKHDGMEAFYPVTRAVPWVNGGDNESAPGTTGFIETGLGKVTLFDEIGRPDYPSLNFDSHPDDVTLESYMDGTSMGSAQEAADYLETESSGPLQNNRPNGDYGYYGAAGLADVFDEGTDGAQNVTGVQLRYTFALRLPGTSSSFDGFGLDSQYRAQYGTIVMGEADDVPVQFGDDDLSYEAMRNKEQHPAVTVTQSNFDVTAINEPSVAGAEGESNATGSGPDGGAGQLSLTWSTGNCSWRVDNTNPAGSGPVSFTLVGVGENPPQTSGTVNGGQYGYPAADGPNGRENHGKFVELDTDTAKLLVNGEQVDTKARGNCNLE